MRVSVEAQFRHVRGQMKLAAWLGRGVWFYAEVQERLLQRYIRGPL